MEDLDKGDDFLGCQGFLLVNVPCAWSKWSLQIFCLNKNVDIFNFVEGCCSSPSTPTAYGPAQVTIRLNNLKCTKD